MSTIEAEAPTTEAQEPPQDSRPAVTADAERSREELFHWNRWVHVGAGAQECEFAKAVADRTDLTKPVTLCENPEHFHAWIRLPNPLQRRDIVDKARAARARKARELRDPNSDSAVILDDELEVLRAEGDMDVLVTEIVDRHFNEDMVKATNEVMDLESDEEPDDEADETPLKYASIDQDIEELHRQENLPEEQRDGEYERLKAWVQGYNEEVDRHLQRIREARREHLTQQGTDHLIDLVRKDRVDLISTEHYLHHYNLWQWYICTLKPRRAGLPNERVWAEMNDMRFNAPPEVIAALRDAFEELDRSLMESRRGKGF